MHRRTTSGSHSDLANVVQATVPRLWRFGLHLTGCSQHTERLVMHACTRALSKAGPDLVINDVTITLFSAFCASWAAGTNFRPPGTSIHFVSDCSRFDAKYPNRRDEPISSYKWLRTSVSQLPDDERVALLLTYVEGFSTTEASDILGISLNVVKTRLAHARITLGRQAVNRGEQHDFETPISPQRACGIGCDHEAPPREPRDGLSGRYAGDTPGSISLR